MHLHNIDGGRTVKCTSPVCHQEYQIKDSEKKQRRQNANTTENVSKKRKGNAYHLASEEELSERKRMKCHKKTFKALCGTWESENAARKKHVNGPVTYKDLPLDVKLMICKCYCRI